MIGMIRGVRSPRAKGRDAAELGGKTRTRMGRVESNRTAEGAAARCSAEEVAGMTQVTQEGRLTAMPGLEPELAPTGRVITTTGFPRGGLVRQQRPKAKERVRSRERVSSMRTRPPTARLGVPIRRRPFLRLLRLVIGSVAG